MESRWFNIAVILVWLSTSSWLVVSKVIPPLRRGQPPNYQSMYTQHGKDDEPAPPVAWEMSLNGKPLGWAVSKVVLASEHSRDTSLTDISSRIHFDRIPLAELSPAWMTKILLRSTIEPVDNLQMDAISSLKIDSLGHLAEFDSSLSAAGVPNSIAIRGKVRASLLRGEVKTAEFAYPFEIYLPGDALVSDELSPQSRLTGLHLGQEWTVPVFSPLRDPRSPVEILQACVDSRDLLMWEGEAVPVFQVVYRPDSGAALSSTGQPRAKLWVRDDGTVLKQEVAVLSSRLVFSRMSDERSVAVAKKSDEDMPDRRFFRPRRFGPWNNPPNKPTEQAIEQPPSAPEATAPGGNGNAGT
jgi:hypothetical protein